MRWVLVSVVVAVLAATAVWFSLGSSPERSPGRIEVVWRGFVAAVVTDYVNATSRTEFFLDFGNGTRVLLDLSNATLRLRDHFAAYVGNPDKPVYVRGLWDGKQLRAAEVYD